MKTLELKYKIPMQGEYNEYISECLDCDYIPTKPHWYYSIGWFQLLGEWCLVWECPNCGAKWYHHDRELSHHRHFLIQKEHNLIK